MLRTAARVEPLELRIAPATIFAVDSGRNLITFDSEAPGEILSTTPLTGLGPTEVVSGIDFRPSTGQLYLFGTTPAGANDTGRIFVVNPVTGAAFAFGTPISSLSPGAAYGFDFNPFSDRIRVVNTADESARINPFTGNLVQFDTPLNDPANAEVISAVAYDRNFDGATLTTLFGIDSALDRLVRIGGVDGTPSSNLGELTTIGPLGVVPTSSLIGFDIDVNGTAYASIEVGGVTTLYTINLSTGAATSLGAIGNGTADLTGFAVAPQFVKVVNATTATFKDADGDLVTIKTTAGNLNGAGFTVASREGGGLQLRALDLTGGAGNFQKTSVSITARPVGGKGNGFTEVGLINATGLDLSKVVVQGDLGHINAGDTNTAFTSPAIASLTVHSLGAFGLETQIGSGLPLTSVLGGPLGKLSVKTDVVGAIIDVSGGATPANGVIASVFIGGNVIGSPLGGGKIVSSGKMGVVKVLGSIVGAGAIDAGKISAAGDIASISIGGSLIGDAFVTTGTIQSLGKIGKVTVRGSLLGGAGAYSGAIFATGALGSVTIGGSMLGSTGTASGAVWTEASLASVKVAGDITGGTPFFSGSIRAGTSIGAIAVKGSVTAISGVIADSTGIYAGKSLGTISIGGDLRSYDPTVPVVISAVGESNPATAAQALAIKSVTVRGSVIHAEILAGYLGGVVPSNPDAIIGAINVTGNWLRSVAAAGVNPNGNFADANDVAVTDATPDDNIVSKIASVTIKGWAAGTFDGTDGYGFVAPHIGKLKIGLTTYPLQPGPGNDTIPIFIGPTGDLRVREV